MCSRRSGLSGTCVQEGVDFLDTFQEVRMYQKAPGSRGGGISVGSKAARDTGLSQKKTNKNKNLDENTEISLPNLTGK